MLQPFIQTKTFSKQWDALGLIDDAKSKKSTLSAAECSQIRQSIKLLEDSLKEAHNE